MNKWVLVTGAAKRIGRATALGLAKSDWNVVIHYNRSQAAAMKLADEIKSLGRKVLLAEIDLLNLKLVQNLIPSLNAEIGPLSALVNNASLFELDENDPDGSEHMTINAEAPRLLSEVFCQQISTENTGVIVNLLDSCTPSKGFHAYIRSKQALKAQTLKMALQCGPKVRINGVAPGPVFPGLRESVAHFESLYLSTPLRAQVKPENITATISFLIENSSITGEIIHTDSGAHLLHRA